MSQTQNMTNTIPDRRRRAVMKVPGFRAFKLFHVVHNSKCPQACYHFLFLNKPYKNLHVCEFIDSSFEQCG